MFLQRRPTFFLWAGTGSCLILSRSTEKEKKVSYYLQPPTLDWFYLRMIHSLISARHQRKSKKKFKDSLTAAGYEVFEEESLEVCPDEGTELINHVINYNAGTHNRDHISSCPSCVNLAHTVPRRHPRAFFHGGPSGCVQT